MELPTIHVLRQVIRMPAGHSFSSGHKMADTFHSWTNTTTAARLAITECCSLCNAGQQRVLSLEGTIHCRVALVIPLSREEVTPVRTLIRIPRTAAAIAEIATWT